MARASDLALPSPSRNSTVTIAVRIPGQFDTFLEGMASLYNYKERKAGNAAKVNKSDIVRMLLLKSAPLLQEEFKKKYGEAPDFNGVKGANMITVSEIIKRRKSR